MFFQDSLEHPYVFDFNFLTFLCFILVFRIFKGFYCDLKWFLIPLAIAFPLYFSKSPHMTWMQKHHLWIFSKNVIKASRYALSFFCFFLVNLLLQLCFDLPLVLHRVYIFIYLLFILMVALGGIDTYYVYSSSVHVGFYLISLWFDEAQIWIKRPTIMHLKTGIHLSNCHHSSLFIRNTVVAVMLVFNFYFHFFLSEHSKDAY